MPSKPNKKNKQHSQSPHQTPSSTPLTNNEPISTSILQQASSKFPSFFSISTLISRLSHFDSSSPHKGFKIWLSESAFLSSSLSPASLVSISLPSVGSTSTSEFPLSSLAVECSEQFGVQLQNVEDRAGNYFVLATAFHSSKLQKNEVRISLSLSYTLGHPTVGTTLFVHPIGGGSLTSLMDGYGDLCNSTLDHPSVYHCKELYIKLLPPKRGYEMNVASYFPSKKGPDITPNRYGNGKFTSPITPVSKISRPCSPDPSMVSSMTSEDSASRSTSRSNPVDVQEILRDENAKKLLERSVVSWLNSRVLLCGNLVAIPVLSQLCVFEVVGAKKLSGDDVGQDCTLSHHTDEGFIVDHVTKIHICLTSEFVSETTVETKSVPCYVGSGDVNVNLGDEVAKYKDLSSEHKEKLWKEYTLLKHIISSSVNNSLSRFT